MPMVQEPGPTSFALYPEDMRNFALMSAVMMKVLLVLKVDIWHLIPFYIGKLHMFTLWLTQETKPSMRARYV